MQFKLLTLAALAAGASAQMMNLTALLSSTPQLSNLTTYVSFYPAVLDALSAAKNITILAPSNEAFSKLMASPAGAAIQANDTALIQAVLTYHVLNGTYPASEVTAMPAFIPTLLMNMNYTNVTGGQVVEAVKMGSNVTFISGLLMNSTVTKAVSWTISYSWCPLLVVFQVPSCTPSTLPESSLPYTPGALLILLLRRSIRLRR